MPRKKNNFVNLIMIAIIVIAAVSLVRHFHLKNFHKIVPGVLYTSGQPRGMDYTRVFYKYHIATIINLRQSDEHREDHWYNEELTWTRENGVKYIELPMDKDQLPDMSTQRKFVRLMSDKSNLPVLLHDSNGRKRVAMLTAVWMVRSGKYNIGETLEAVEKIKGGAVTKEEKEFIEGL
jgi:protein tyrosine/serine phosphatase